MHRLEYAPSKSTIVRLFHLPQPPPPPLPPQWPLPFPLPPPRPLPRSPAHPDMPWFCSATIPEPSSFALYPFFMRAFITSETIVSISFFTIFTSRVLWCYLLPDFENPIGHAKYKPKDSRLRPVSRGIYFRSAIAGSLITAFFVPV